jgi:antitoxin HigA-1
MMEAVDEDLFAPVTPGEILGDEFLAEYDLSEADLADALGVSAERITELVGGRRPITADDALRLSLYFGNSAEFWLNLQTHYDLKLARRALSPQEAARIVSRRAA